jgi:hypothetical protein
MLDVTNGMKFNDTTGTDASYHYLEVDLSQPVCAILPETT